MVTIETEVMISARHRRGLTQEQLAVQLGVSKNTIAKWESGENGKSRLRPGNFKKLCEILRVQSEDLQHDTSREINGGDNLAFQQQDVEATTLDQLIPKDFEWVFRLTGYPDEMPPAKKANGVWVGSGGELDVNSALKNATESKQLQFSFRLRQVGSRLVAAGIDHDGDKVLFRGKMTDEGSFIFGTYRIFTGQRELYGNATLSYDGDHMKGYYVGRDSEHKQGLAIGWMELDRQRKEA